MTEQQRQYNYQHDTSCNSNRPNLQNISDSAPKQEFETEHSALLSHYHNLEKIGHGSQATMLKALDNQNHPVAIKVFDYSKVSDWKDVELFEREIEVLKNLNMDGVPKYIETIKTDKVIYLVEQYIDALSIEKQMKHGKKFTIDESVTILEHTANILKKLSQCKPPIVHRDIKPANLLVDDDLNVWLVDFGVVSNTQQTLSMTFAGTAGYVAPEQLYGKSTPASDIFSLGATMLYLVTQVAPCDMQLKGVLPNFDKYIPDTVPEWLSQTIKTMMAADATERPQNGEDLSKLIQHNKARKPNKTITDNEPLDSDEIDSDEINEYTEYSPKQLMHDYNKTMTRKRRITGFSWGIFTLLVILTPLVFILFMVGIEIINDTQFFTLLVCDACLISIILLLILPITAICSGIKKRHIINSTGLNTHELQVLLKKALDGDDNAQFLLGSKYYYGNDVEKDRKIASEWYMPAAKKGNAKAQNQLGLMYENGDGVKESEEESIKWYKKAAEQGHVFAIQKLEKKDDE